MAAGNAPRIGNSDVKIADLKYGMKNVSVNAMILEIGPLRRTATSNDVRTVLVGDPTGVINLSVWNDYCHVIKAFDIIRIRGGIVTAHKRSLGLSVGKSGDITKFGEFNLPISEKPNLSEENYLTNEQWEWIRQEEESRRGGFNGKSE